MWHALIKSASHFRHCSVQRVNSRWGKRPSCFPRLLALGNVKRQGHITESVFCFLTQCFMVSWTLKWQYKKCEKGRRFEFYTGAEHYHPLLTTGNHDLFQISFCGRRQRFLEGRMRIHQRVKDKGTFMKVQLQVSFASHFISTVNNSLTYFPQILQIEELNWRKPRDIFN